jgi:hypothetical protein
VATRDETIDTCLGDPPPNGAPANATQKNDACEGFTTSFANTVATAGDGPGAPHVVYGDFLRDGRVNVLTALLVPASVL